MLTFNDKNWQKRGMTKKVYHETVTRKQQRTGENPIKYPGLLNSTISPPTPKKKCSRKKKEKRMS